MTTDPDGYAELVGWADRHSRVRVWEIEGTCGHGAGLARLDRGRHGDPQLNRALHTVTLARLRSDPTTQTYAARRTRAGKTPREIKRCLERYAASDLYRLLQDPPQAA